jgi:hypothetical protein
MCQTNEPKGDGKNGAAIRGEEEERKKKVHKRGERWAVKLHPEVAHRGRSVGMETNTFPNYVATSLSLPLLALSLSAVHTYDPEFTFLGLHSILPISFSLSCLLHLSL